MTDAQSLITENIDIWTTAIKKRLATGRGSNKKIELTGIIKLRELILELAVRGKLVPQDPNDEPASVLLEKIAAEKAQLIKDKKIKKTKALPEIVEDEKPFELPDGWEIQRFGNIYSLEYGKNLPKPKRSNCGKYNVYGSNGVVGSHNETSINNPCIIIGRKGSAGALNLCNQGGCWVTDVAYSSIPPKGIDLTFAFIHFHTFGLDSLGKGIKPGLNRNEAYILVITLPPLAEQHRIVTKVNELMLLCDKLEQQTEDSITAHQTLIETLLDSLSNSESPAAFNQNWTRIAEHFDTLFTTEHSIDQLKQTILHLAVMGKLVSQNPNDQPASVLLEKIAAEKEQLIKDKKIKKQKPLPAITEDEKPFDLPSGWGWSKLGNITIIRGGKRLPKGKRLTTSPTPYIYIRVSDMKQGTISNKDLHYISEDIRNQISSYIITKNDIYMTIVGATIGKCGLVPSKFDGMNLTENAARLVPYTGIDKTFLFKCLDSSVSQSQFFDKTKQVGVQKMALHRLASTKVPLPPLAEQQRIVTKVDELMTLCDQLKASLSNAQTTQLHLADAIVKQTVN